MSRTPAGSLAILSLLTALLWASQSQSQEPAWGLFVDIGSPRGAPSMSAIDDDLHALRDRLVNLTGSSPDRFTLSTGGNHTRQAIASLIRDFGSRAPAGAPAYIYLRGYVHKPRTENAIYVMPSDASLDAGAGGSPAPIRDSELRSWLASVRSSEVVLMMDLMTRDAPLGIFHGNRTTLGSIGLTVIALKPLGSSMARLLAQSLTPTADSDGDGVLRPDEVANTLQSRVYTRGITAADAIVGLTGANDVALATLPAGLTVETSPEGATVLVDGVEVGKSPYRLSQLRRKVYSVSARMPGYRDADPVLVNVTRTRGKSYSAAVALSPVRIRGTVSVPAGVQVTNIVVTVRPDIGLTRVLSAPGAFEFDTTGAALKSGETYRIIAATADDRLYGEATAKFSGTTDIDVAIEAAERTSWEVAQIRFEAGYPDQALASAAEARRTAYELPSLSSEFADFLLEAWGTQTGASRAMIASAQLAAQLGDPKASRAYWRLALRASAKGSDDRAYAADQLRAAGGGAAIPMAAAAAFLLAVLTSLAWIVWRRRRNPAA